jgi:acetoin utilization deacetylase AcuC-like enzyme
MKIVFDARQLLHAPDQYFRRGALTPHPEQPERAILLRDALIAAGHKLAAPLDHGLAPIEAVHDPDFVSFMMKAWPQWCAETGAATTAVPNYHVAHGRGRAPGGVIGRLGYYATDTACPVMAGTAEAIYWSAQAAVDAAARVAAGEETHVYALCRPPGHHAYKDATSGFCFFNNAAIAAQHLRRHFARVAIIDVDTHGGNGTQDIFYERGDVFFASIHVDPSNYPPYFLGYADETGTGPGTGTTLNLLLKPGADEAAILAHIHQAVLAAAGFGAQALVISLGFDMAADDPLSVVGMTTAGFTEAARHLAGLALPTVLVQEGGYLGPSLARNAVAFLGAFDDCRKL